MQGGKRRMLTMDQIHDIRRRYYEKGGNISQIASALQLDWRTVRKYIDMKDFNEPVAKPASQQRFCPKLDAFKPVIDEWLENDKSAPRSQRHTAKRVYKRLTKEVEGFNCSYRLVAQYVSYRKKQIYAGENAGYLPLEHKPGEAQVDFGTAEFYENGRRVTGKYLEVSFPYSNKGFLQLFYGENMECLLEGLDTIFRHIGGVPHELWFDNTKTIVTNIIRDGGRNLTDKFQRFREHYGFKAVFTNPGEGHEKGNVESKVGYQRRNFLVPVPRFLSLSDFNRQLLTMCEEDADREHYRHNQTIEELFQADRKALKPLPSIPFDLTRRVTQKANKWGKVYLNKGLHEYSVSPKHAGLMVNIVLSSGMVIIQDENYREIVRHKRLYGDYKQQSMDWLPYLKQLSHRPRALKYSGVYEMMPKSMRQYLESCQNSEVGQILKILAELTESTGFESAVNTVNQALQYQVTDSDSLKSLYRRLYMDVPELPPMQLYEQIPTMQTFTPSLTTYDEFIKRREAVGNAGS
jgi:transposase